jgi:hypothetical protein
MDNQLQVIADPHSEGTVLNTSIQSLGTATEPPSFWTAIANSTVYSEDHRRRAVFSLFQRHVSPGVTLTALAQIPANPTWLRDEDVSIVTRLGGKLPVQWSPTDTIFVLSIFPDLPDGIYQFWAIYLRVEGKVERDQFLALIRGQPGSGAIGNPKVQEIGYVPANPFARN